MKQVVLPDDKNADKDIVVFLNEAQAAGTSEEAQGRGAVAALARVAGNRNMQRVLPQPFQAAWTWCQQAVSGTGTVFLLMSCVVTKHLVAVLLVEQTEHPVEGRNAVCDGSLRSNLCFAVTKQCTWHLYMTFSG